MKYGILLWPHANGRYQQAVQPLALCEARLLLSAAGIDAEPRLDELFGAGIICFEAPELGERARALLALHSLNYLLCELHGDRLTPIGGRAKAFLGHDLNGILKYKGKTNERFTSFLVNMALLSGAFADAFDHKLCLFDPMCGRLTTLFEACNRGYDAWGADLDGREIGEGLTFFRKYLEHHHFKHAIRQDALTLPGKRSAQVRRISFAADAAGYRAGDQRTLSATELDCESAARAFGAGRFHMAAFDMPYGVQHGPGGRESFEKLLGRVAEPLLAALKPGGAVALSFNSHTLKAETARAVLTNAGFGVCRGESYDHLAHWVEQAIVRDVVVAQKL